MAELSRKVGEMAYDGLVTDITPPIAVSGDKIARLDEKATLVRGTILARNADGLLAVLGSNPGGEITEDFDADGNVQSFTLAADPLPVKINSVLDGEAEATITGYNAQTGVVTLSAKPSAGTKSVHIKYDNPAPDKPCCILCDDTEVGTSDDVPAAVYVGGCFDPQKCTVAENYTLSAADKDALRESGILFKAASTM